MPYKQKVQPDQLPADFPRTVLDTVSRIDDNHNVVGVVYLQKQEAKMCTVPTNMSQGLIEQLPVVTAHVRRALGEIDVLDELVAFRIESKAVEVLIAPAEDCIACAVLKLHTKRRRGRNKVTLP